MKRATLNAYPTTPASEPGDITDRLLEREGNPSTAPPAQPHPRQTGNGPARPKTQPAVPTAMAAPAVAESSLEAALVAAESAADALRQAAREAPARYEVALRYRLDALAHHLQQVSEFVTAVATR